MQSATHPPRPSKTQQPIFQSKEMRRILASSFIGNVIELYDFMLYATAAAVVFGPLFFAGQGSAIATIASFGTLAVGYFARPLGGILFGHFGDRFGRKTTLVVSMTGMGIATVAIGLLPTAAQIGPAAPILLVAARIVQGLAVGGEWGGTVLIAFEHAPEKRRGYAASFANMGSGVGVALATLVFSAFTLLPEDAFLSWGWRVPFLLSFALIVVGMVIRLSVSESPVFQDLERRAEARRVPVIEVLSKHSRSVVLGLFGGLSIYAIAGMVAVWGLSHAIEAGADATGALNAKAAAAVGAFVMTIIGARLSDRIGRKPVLLAGVALGAAFAFPILHLMDAGTVAGYAAAVILGQLIQGLLLGPIGAFIAELFPTRVRYTGVSVAYQGASAIGSGLTPVIASGLLLLSNGSLVLLGIGWIGGLLVCGFAIAMTREGREANIQDIQQ